MNVYISEFGVLDEYKAERNKEYDGILNETMSILNIAEINITRSNIFTDYQMINKNIYKCDLLIAIIDDYWTSSTWKMHELTYGSRNSEQASLNTIKENGYTIAYICNGTKEIPIFSEMKNVEFYRNKNEYIKRIKEIMNLYLKSSNFS